MDDYPRVENYSIASTGDEERDRKALAAFVAREKRLIEGICANGCGPMERVDCTQRCPKCGFVYCKV